YQIFPQLWEVVDLPVEDDPNRLVLVVDGLVTPRQVNDAETPHPQPHGTLRINPLIIRPAVNYRLAHLMNHPSANVSARCGPNNACDSAHDSFSSSFKTRWNDLLSAATTSSGQCQQECQVI